MGAYEKLVKACDRALHKRSGPRARARQFQKAIKIYESGKLEGLEKAVAACLMAAVERRL
jgi:hypothetical protein